MLRFGLITVTISVFLPRYANVQIFTVIKLMFHMILTSTKSGFKVLFKVPNICKHIVILRFAFLLSVTSQLRHIKGPTRSAKSLPH